MFAAGGYGFVRFSCKYKTLKSRYYNIIILLLFIIIIDVAILNNHYCWLVLTDVCCSCVLHDNRWRRRGRDVFGQHAGVRTDVYHRRARAGLVRVVTHWRLVGLRNGWWRLRSVRRQLWRRCWRGRRGGRRPGRTTHRHAVVACAQRRRLDGRRGRCRVRRVFRAGCRIQ